MLLQLTLKSHTINTANPFPYVKVQYDDSVVYNGTIEDTVTFDYETYTDGELKVTHYNKHINDDTILVDGKIVNDKAVEIISVKIDEIDIPLSHLYDQKYHTSWPDVDPIISNTLYLGYNGTYILPVIADSDKFYYSILWDSERRLNGELHQHNVNADGEIVETFTRFGESTAIDDSQVPSINKLYEMVSKLVR